MKSIKLLKRFVLTTFPPLLGLVVILRSLCLQGNLFAQPTRWYFSSSMGNDNNTGTTPTSPWKSMDRLQALLNGNVFNGKSLQRGDTIFFLRGDTFRTARVTSSGIVMNLYLNSHVFKSPGNQYITFKDYGPPTAPKPVFKGSLRLDQMPGGTVIQQGNLVKISNPFHPDTNFVITRVFYKGKPLVLARYPNDSLLLVEQVKYQSTAIDSFYSSALTSVPDSWFPGAVFWTTLSGFSWGISQVLDKQGPLLRIAPGDYWGQTPTRGNRFYLENKKEFLDKPGEWYFDKHSDTLYILLPLGTSISFKKSDFDIQFTKYNPNNYPTEAMLFYIVHWPGGYVAMPPDPLHHIIIRNLHFEHGEEGIRLGGVKHVEISHCTFRHFYRALWNFLSEDVQILNNTFYNSEALAIGVLGRQTPGYEGNPAAMTKRVLVENNFIKHTGVGNRWKSDPLYHTISHGHLLDDVSILLASNLDSVIVRHNRIDSISQTGILAVNFHAHDTLWNKLYAGSIPFIIEKNYITNYCLDFSDCGGIKLGTFLNGGIVRNNILYKDIYGKDNHDKSWLGNFWFTLSHFGGNGCGIYSDVFPRDVIIENNTCVGGDVNNHNYAGGTYIQRVISRKNTLYGGLVSEMTFVAVPVFNSFLDSCEAEENLFFHLNQAEGSVVVQDYSHNSLKDTIWRMNKNRYFSPTYGAPYHFYRHETGERLVTGLQGLKTNTTYEASPLSYWGDYALFDYWDNSNVVLGNLITNSHFNNNNPLPINPFGGAQLLNVSNSPLGGPALLITCPTTPPSWGAGFVTNPQNPIYSSTLSPHDVYKISFLMASAKKKDFEAILSFRTYHPKTGDTLYTRDHFVIPIPKAFQPDTIQIYYKPRLFQSQNEWRFYLQKNDSIWLKFFKIEKIDTSTIKPLTFYYPIFLNPSDNAATFSLPPCHVYLDTDSQLVVNNVSVAPWSSRILIYQTCDSTLTSLPNENVYQTSTVLVYPNPVHDMLYIMNGTQCRYELTDLNGKILSTGILLPGHHFLPVANLPTGIYILNTYRHQLNGKGDGKIENNHFKILKY